MTLQSPNNIIRDRLDQWRQDPLYKNSVYFFLNTVSISGLGFLFWWFATRLYDTEFVGQAVVIITTAQLITTISNFGFSFSLIRFLPVTSDKPRFINLVFSFVGISTIVVSILVVAIGFRISPSLSVLGSSGFPAGFVIFVFLLASYQLSYPILATLRAAKLLFWVNSIAAFGRIFFLIIFGQYFETASVIILAFFIPILFAVLIIFGALLPRLIASYSPRIILNLKELKPYINYSSSSYVGNILHDLPYQVLPHIVANWISFSAAAYFYIVWNLFGFLTTLSNSISLSLFIEGSYQFNRLKIYAKKTTTFIVLMSSSFAIVVIILADIILSIFGQGFSSNATLSIRIIAIASIPASIVYAMVASFRVRKILRAVIITYAVIAVISLGPALFGILDSLDTISWFWLIAQIIALLYLVIIDRNWFLRE